ncbi:MAG: hypothetical protein R8M11_10150 [Gallionella sp.]
MIVIENFLQAIHLQQQGAIPLRILQDQAMVLFNINPEPNRYVDEALDITPDDIERLSTLEEATEDYNGMLGGEGC